MYTWDKVMTKVWRLYKFEEMQKGSIGHTKHVCQNTNYFPRKLLIALITTSMTDSFSEHL